MDVTTHGVAPNCHVLNNSPALHSLKRQQLLQLCKRNGIKASGKNTEIVERLKTHALKMNVNPSMLSRQTFSRDDGDKENRRFPTSRPSEQWTVIEEDSREIELSTGPSFTKLTMHSEEPPVNDLLSTSIPYDDQLPIYPPLPNPEPLDANDSRDQSMLELGAGTIRLVTPTLMFESPPKLRPFTPTFEPSYSPGSPSAPSIYPTLPVDQDSDPSFPGAFPKMSSTPSALLKTPASPAQPFLFGSVDGGLSKKRKFGDTARRPNEPTNARARRVSRVVTPGTRRSLVAAAAAEEVDGRKVKRVRISTARAGADTEAEHEGRDGMDVDEDEETRKAREEREKERAAIKKKLAVSRARRRSSKGRVSVGAGHPALIPNQPKKGIATKFGFLSSSKTLVRSMWNKAVGTAPPSKPIEPAALKHSLPAGTRTSTVSSLASGPQAVRRGPIPSFQSLVGRVSRTNSLASGGTAGSRTSGTGTTSSRGGSVAKPGSMGTRKLGLSADGSNSSVVGKRTSTLFAPTASSLAKMQSTVRPPFRSAATDGRGLAKVPEQRRPSPSAIPSFTFTSPPPVGGVSNPSDGVTSVLSGGLGLTSISSASTGTKPHALPPRRPRISRSRVIAKLGERRAASGSSLASNASARRSLNVVRPRGSLSARASGVGVKSRGREAAAAMSARKRLRQSEVLRRRSKVGAFPPLAGHEEKERESTPERGEDSGVGGDSYEKED